MTYAPTLYYERKYIRSIKIYFVGAYVGTPAQINGDSTQFLIDLHRL